MCIRDRSRVFFGNSGAEANEGAIKAARKYSFDKYGADRYNVITPVSYTHLHKVWRFSALTEKPLGV